MLAADFVSAALLVGAAVLAPSALRGSGASTLISSCAVLVAYGSVAFWVSRQTHDSHLNAALQQATPIALILAAFAGGSHALEVWAGVSPQVAAVSGVAHWALPFVGFGAAASAGAAAARSAKVGLYAALWTAIFATSLIVCWALLVALVQLWQLGRDPTGQDGAGQPLLIGNAFDSALLHLVGAPIVAAVSAAISLLTSTGLSRSRRSFVWLGAAAEVVLFASGLYAINVASGLPRSERPPLIMFGLTTLCVSLASAHAVFSAVAETER